MDEQQTVNYVTTTFAGVDTMTNLGYRFFFYGSERMLPFVTIAFENNEHERVSQLDRPGVFRLNIGVSKQRFQALFGTGKIDVSAYDFAALDTIMPHPDYAPQSWICVLNPSETTFRQLQLLLAEAYELAVKRANRRATA